MSRDFAGTTPYVVGVDLAAIDSVSAARHFDTSDILDPLSSLPPLIPKYARWAILQDTYGTGAMLAPNRAFRIDADTVDSCEPTHFPSPDNLRMFINDITKDGSRVWLMEQDGECLGPNISGTSNPVIAFLCIRRATKRTTTNKPKYKIKLPGFRLLDLE